MTLTAPGTELAFGETATADTPPTVARHHPRAHREGRHQGTLTTLKGFDLDTPYKKNANYYFVNVKVENVGEGDLGGRDVPLSGVNEEEQAAARGRLHSPLSSAARASGCRRSSAREKFTTCLVFLSPDHGDLTAVSYRNTETSVPITWSGEITQPTSRATRSPRRTG